MRLSWPEDPRLSLPVRIGDGASDTGPRIGGAPPINVRPGGNGTAASYFVTTPLAMQPELMVSVFLCFTSDEMFAAAGDLARCTELIDVVVHEPRPRGTDLALASGLSAHRLVIGSAQEDVVLEEDRSIVRSSHKLGGRPYFMHGEPPLEDAVAALESTGFRQVLQFDFPGSGDAQVEGDWPFGDGVFHLLGREPFSPEDWRAFWEF